MLMSALRQILNMSPALLIDNNIFNSPFGTASDHSSRSKPTPSFSKMMQKALKNKTHNLLEPHHTIVIYSVTEKKWWFSNIYIHIYSNSMTMLFLTFGLLLLLITIVYWSFEPKYSPSQPQNNIAKRCFYFAVKYDSP